MKIKRRSTHPSADRGVVQDWQPLFAAFENVADWALDIAAKLSRDYPEDSEAVENVRTFVHAWLEGRRSEVPVSDVLTTIGIIFAAIEIDIGIDSMQLLGPLRTMHEKPSRLPALLRLPGAARDDKPTVIIRRSPGRRNASSGFTALAA